MSYDEIVSSSKVEEQWREEFAIFIGTGRCSTEYAAHLDYCSNCQAAVDNVIEAFEKTLPRLRDWRGSQKAE